MKWVERFRLTGSVKPLCYNPLLLISLVVEGFFYSHPLTRGLGYRSCFSRQTLEQEHPREYGYALFVVRRARNLLKKPWRKLGFFR
jgi:hypothetical protein